MTMAEPTPLGAYLKVLRERQGHSRSELGVQADVSEMSLLRIEDRGQMPGADLLSRLRQILQATWDDLDEVLKNDATIAGAEALAHARYAALLEELPQDAKDAIEQAEQQSRERRREIARRLRRMAQDLDPNDR